MFVSPTRSTRSILFCSTLTLAAWLFSLTSWREPKAAGAAAVFATITVNTTADTVAMDGVCSLREAIQAANTNTAVNECQPGTPGLDTIQFDIGAGTPTINVTSPLPTITESLMINGNTGGATRVELNGTGVSGSGLLVQTGNSTIKSMVINRFGLAGIVLTSGNGNVVQGCFLGTDATGTLDRGNATNGIFISSANNLIGGTTPAMRNVISGNDQDGVALGFAAGANNLVQGNFIGTDLNGTAALGNSGQGVRIDSGASGNSIGGTAAGAANIIAFNTGRGVFINQNTTINNRVSSNAIFSNGTLGIDLNSDGGVTANDAGDPDTGPNNLQNFPVLNFVTSTGAINGSLDSTNANSAYPVRLEFFANTACDGSGNGEGEVLLGSTVLNAPGSFNFTATLVAGKNFITATATDNNGNTSEFSACRLINTIPTITAITNSRQQGSAATNSQIATVTDPDQALNTLTVQVNNGASATVNGITVSNLTVTAGGAVNANVVASCAATNASFTLKVLDNANEMSTATLTVNVTANTAPVLTYNNQAVARGGPLTINPASGPSDNGSISTIAVQSQGTYTGTISVNNSTGVVSLSNAMPVGMHMITIQATDNCGLNTSNTFTLTVNKADTTLTSLTDVPDPSVTGQSYTAGFTLNVTPPGAGTPTGTVTVTDGTGGTCTATLPATSCALSSATMGVKTLTFTYSGDANFNSSSNTAGHLVNKANTTTTIIADNPDPSVSGGNVVVNFTVMAAAPGSGTPTGNVVITVSGGSETCTGAVAAGTCTLALTAPGNRTLTATFAGDANYNGSADTEAHTVNCPTITVNPSNPTLPTAQAGQSYSQTFTQTGGNGAITWSVSTGALPNGLTLNATTGLLSGTPVVFGLFNFTIRATDANNCTGVRAYTLTINNLCATIDPPNQTFAVAGGSGTVTVTGPGCNWTAMSNAPWITVTGGSSGTGNGTVNYSVATNPGALPRAGTMTIAGLTFTVNQAAPGLLVETDFSGPFPPLGWGLVDGGTGTYPGGAPATWTNANPCNRVIPPPFSGSFAIVDASCAGPSAVLDEELRTPAFNATGLGQVFVEFFNQFQWDAVAPNNTGDVDVSINGGMTWTNVLRLQGGDDGVPIPNTKTLNITSFIAANPANVLVRFRYFGSGAPFTSPTSPTGEQRVEWAFDFSVYYFAISPASQSFPGAGGSGSVAVTAAPGRAWTVQSNAPWLTPTTMGGTGSGPANFNVAANQTGVPRSGTLTIAGNSFTVNQAALVCPTITVNPATLPNGFVGAAYNQTISATGGTAPYTFAVTTGTLPGGLTLAGGGALTGTPTTVGTFNFTVTATDNTGCTGTRAYTVVINAANPGLQFFPLPQPVRLLETRAGFSGCTTPGAPINANGTLTLPARTTCAGIPANAAAVTGNITVVPSGPGFLTLFPSTAAQPTVANSNFQTNEITNNVFTVGLGAGDGAFKIFSSATTHVIVDVTGYYAPPGTGGLYFHPLATPVRLLETRPTFSGCIAPGTQLIGTGDPNADPNLDLLLQGRSPVAAPCNSIPATAQVLVGNATSVSPTALGYLTIYPSGGTRPTVASSNYAGSDVINGPFAVKLGADGKFKIYTFATTHLVVDILGYYSAEALDANGAGLLFNPLPSPVRLLETRAAFSGCTNPGMPITGNLALATHTQMAANFCGLPAVAQAIVGNVSVVNTTGAGFLTMFPANLTTAPLVATSNYPAPATFGYNRHYFVGLSPADGKFKVLTQFTTDLILDASGYFAP